MSLSWPWWPEGGSGGGFPAGGDQRGMRKRGGARPGQGRWTPDRPLLRRNPPRPAGPSSPPAAWDDPVILQASGNSFGTTIGLVGAMTWPASPDCRRGPLLDYLQKRPIDRSSAPRPQFEGRPSQRGGAPLPHREHAEGKTGARILRRPVMATLRRRTPGNRGARPPPLGFPGGLPMSRQAKPRRHRPLLIRLPVVLSVVRGGHPWFSVLSFGEESHHFRPATFGIRL